MNDLESAELIRLEYGPGTDQVWHDFSDYIQIRIQRINGWLDKSSRTTKVCKKLAELNESELAWIAMESVAMFLQQARSECKIMASHGDRECLKSQS